MICDPATASLRAWWYPTQLVLLVVLGVVATMLPNGRVLALAVFGFWMLASLCFALRWLVKLVAVVAGSSLAAELVTRATLSWCILGCLLCVVVCFVGRVAPVS